MDYKELKKNYFDDLGIDGEASKDIRLARTDLNNTLREMYYKAQAPKRSIAYDLTSTTDTIEDFADSTYITGFTVDSNFALNTTNTRLESSNDTANIYLSNLKSLESLIIEVSGDNLATVTDFATAELVVKNNSNTILFDQIILFTKDDASIETLSFLPAIAEEAGVTLSATLTITKTADYNEVWVNSFQYTSDLHSLILPEDFFIPLMVIFKDSDKAILQSNEVSFERFIKWIPTTLSADEDIQPVSEDINKIYFTSENLDFDRSIGYYFNVDSTGITLNWKSNFNGSVEIVYTALPTVNAVDNTTIEINKAFYETLLNGAVSRGLLRLIKDSKEQATTEALVISYREYRGHYKEGLSDFIGFTKNTAEPFAIKAFDFLNDSDMLRS